jgi:histone-lysine N-methyltransferase SETDB1
LRSKSNNLISVKKNIYREEQGKIVKLDLKKLIKNKNIMFDGHSCSKKCVSKWESNLKSLSNSNKLLVPIYCGWKRQIGQQSKENRSVRIDKTIYYVSPCGIRCRNIIEIDHYLEITKSNLRIGMFSCDMMIEIDRVFEVNCHNLKINDISYGKESVPISCVNCIDLSKPEIFDYSKVRLPIEDVPLNSETSLLDCCDCIDGCRDRLKCSCWRKTIEATLITNKMLTNVGYNHRKLHNVLNTGIFECNINCKCDERCSNRVVQNGISVRLQLFKVSNEKGWGVRCLDDIPKGTFISTYSGHVISETQSSGRKNDEYFAELDFIKCLEKERRKNLNDETLEIEKTTEFTSNGKNEIKISKNKSKASEAFDIINSNRFITNPNNPFYFRNYLEKNEIFIIDAKKCANIGRFFNHSCSPNLFVQNVFIDTYDLRFPWIAFFAAKNIRAGTELCWDYNYEPNSVKGRVLYCQCGSATCRGRLL